MSGNQHNIERRLTNVEEAIVLLTQKSLHTDDRADDFDAKLSNLIVKLEALTDAQIRTEDALARLAEAQAHSDRRLDALIDIVQNWRNGGGEAGGGTGRA